MTLCKDNEINSEQWQYLVENSDTASFFQTKACYNFYGSLSFMQVFAYAVEDNGKLQALVCGYIVADGNKLKQYFSRRAIVPGGVLIARSAPSTALDLLLNSVSEALKDKAIYIEIRNFNDYAFYVPTFDMCGFRYQPHLNFQIQIKNDKDLFANLSKSKQRQIKMTEKAGAVCVPVSNATEMKEFYQLLQKLYLNKIGLPLFPLEFFEEITNCSFAKLLVVKQSGKVLGGILCVNDKQTVFEWFVCGTELNEPNIYPSVFATWSGIKYAAQNKFQRFDFMGAGKPDQNYGVREFKAKFGGEMVENGRFLKINNKMLYTVGRIALFLQKR